MNLFQILADSADFCTSAAGYRLFGFVGHLFRFLQIIIPVIIIIMGTIDLIKAVVAQKSDEMKKAQSILIKRLIIGVVIFFVPVIVNFLVNLIGGDTTNQCLDCFLKDPSGCVEKGQKMNSNNSSDSGDIKTEESQTEKDSKNICKKCEEQGMKCIENAGSYRCVEKMYE